jgi:hypothetical protein
VLDEVGGGIDHAGDNDLVLGQQVVEVAVLVRVARIGERQHEAANLGAAQERDDLLQLDIEVVRAFVIAPAHVQPHLRGRDVMDRGIDRVDHAIAERDEIRDRPVREGIVLLAREIRTVELQQEARIDDRLVFDPQCGAERGQERLPGRIVLVEHDRRHHAGGGRGQERLGKRVVSRVEHAAEIRALRLHVGGVRIPDVTDRLRQPADVVHRLLPQRRLVGLLLEDRVALDVGALAPLPRAAEPAQPVADVEQERVALLLAVAADVDAGLGLLRYDGAQGRLPRGAQLIAVDRLAARAARVKLRQLERPRQAAGMGGENPLLASTHERPGGRVSALCRASSAAAARSR